MDDSDDSPALRRATLVALGAMRRRLRSRAMHAQIGDLPHPAREVGLQVFCVEAKRCPATALRLT
jgi:hypothetical protein